MVCDHPQGQQRELPSCLPTATELIALRDVIIPKLMESGDNAKLTEVKKCLWKLLITEVVPIDDSALNVNRICVCLWLDSLISGFRPPTKATQTPDEIELCVDSDFEKKETTVWMEEWLLTNGSQRYPEHVDLVAGRALACRSLERLSEYEVKTIISDTNKEVLDHLVTFLERAATINTYERTGDLYLHELMRGKLSCARQSTLAWRETPMKKLPQQYGPTTNDLVRPFIEKNAADQLAETNWKIVDSTDILVLLATLLREQIDGLPLFVLANDHIPRSESKLLKRVPHLFTVNGAVLPLLDSDYGVVFRKTLYVINRQQPYAMLKLIMFYVHKLSEVFDSDSESAESARRLRQFVSAIADPTSISTNNPFIQLMHR